MEKNQKPVLSAEEKTAAAQLRYENLAAANKKRAELKAADKPEPKTAATKDFDSILDDIKAGKEVTLEGEKEVYFKFKDGRLFKFSKEGGCIDSFPLHLFQERTGWALKK